MTREEPRPDRLPERDFVILALISGGETLTDVAKRFGVSRERIRQIAARNGMVRPSSSTIDPLLILRAAETAESLDELLRITGVSRHSAVRVLRALGKWRDTALRWGHWVSRTDDQMLQALRDVASELGHTPMLVELRGRHPSAATYQLRFGSLAEAIGKAGLPLRNQRRDKLSDPKRLEIARRHVPGRTGSAKALAKEYGVSPKCISYTAKKFARLPQ